MLKAAMQKLEAQEGKVWLCKPGFMNRGRGIEIFDNEKDILEHLAKQRSGSSWIVQKYIERPLLVQGRKFDIRTYVLVAPDKRVYMYKEGYIRTTCFEYKVDNLADKFIHLTNDAYQKTSADFGKFEDANKLSYPEFQAAVNGAVDMEKGVVPQLQACLTSVFEHAIGKMNPMRLEYCFELFGIDFMLDEAGRAYLIEMNTSPALFRKGRYLQEMLPRMIEEVVQKCVDPVFPAPEGAAQADRLHSFLQIVPPLL